MKRFHIVLLLWAVLYGGATVRGQVVTETFTNATADGWVFAGTGYTPTLTSGTIDATGDGWLRLTSTGGNQATSAYYDSAFTSANRSVYASFDYASWGGSGADGITFFLFDGSVDFGVGANGGSLGYAQKTGIDGLNGAYLGVAIDEYGNFSNATEGRVGGIGFVPDAIAVRGPGQGQDGYEYLGGVQNPLATSLDYPNVTVRPDQLGDAFRHIEISITATNQLTVSYQAGYNNPMQTILTLDLSGYERPDTLKFGFTSGTGGLTNYHEVRNLNIATVASNMWDGGAGNGQWGSAANWNPDFLPAAGSEILLNNSFVSTAQTIDVGTTRTVRSITIDAPFSYTLNNGTLEFDSGGVGGLNGIFVTQTNGVAASNTIGSALSLNNNIFVRNQTTGTLNLTGAVATNGRSVTFDGTGNTVASGVVSGTGSIAKSATGTLTLSGANTYSGGTTISNGTLNANHNSALGTGGVTLQGGTLASTTGRTVSNSIALTGNAGVSNITTSGTLTQTDGNRTLAMNNATHSGGVNLSNNTTSRTLTLQVDSGTSTISGVIANGGGSTGGGLTKTGSGNLRLSGANTYTGTTTISAGSLTLGASDRLADASAVSIGTNGRLNLNGFSEKIGQLTAAGGATLDFGTTGTANTFIFGTYVPPPSGVLVVNNWESALDKLATTSAISAADAGTIYISGHGIAQRAASMSAMGGSYGNAYLLTPTAQVGKVWDGSSSNVWATSANWTAANAPTSTEIAVFNTLGAARTGVVLGANTTIAGFRFESNAPAYTLTASGNRTLTLAGTVPYIQQMSASTQTLNFTFLALGANTVADITGSGNLGIGAIITGTGRSLIRDGTGSGRLILSGANTFSGGVFINRGIVQTRSNAGLGTGTTTISDGAALEVANTITATNAISVIGSGVGGGGAIRSIANTNTLSGTITLGGATTIGSDSGSILNLTGNLTGTNHNLTFTGAGAINVGRITTGTGGVTVNSTGTVTYNSGNANTYTGTTVVNSGTLALGKTAGIAAIAGNLTIAAGSTVRLDANHQIVDSSNITLNGGTFNVNGRTETVASINSSNSASVVALGVGTLTINNAAEAAYAGTLTGTGSLTKIGTGKLSLSGNNTGYSGTTYLNGGILNVSGSNSVLGTGAINIASGGNLEIQGGRTLANAMTLNGTGTSANDGAIQSVTGANTVTGAITLAGNTRIQSDSGSTLTLSNTISGANRTLNVGGAGNTTISGVIGTTTGGLTKDGAGTLTLSGNNTFTGVTAINAGTLQLGASNRLADATEVTVASGATFNLNNFSDTIGSLAGAGSVTLGSGSLITGNANTTAFTGIVSGTGSLTKQGAGTFTLSGHNTYSGGTTLSAGTLYANHNSALGTGGVTLAAGTLGSTNGATLNNTVTLTGNAALSNLTTTGTLTQSGGNRTLTMVDATHSGGVNLSNNTTARALTLQVASGTSTISGAIVNGGGSTGGSVTKTGAGELVLSGANTYSGGTTLSAGTLTADHNSALGTGGVTLAAGTLGSTTGATVNNTITLTGNAGLSNITTSGTMTQSGANRTLTMVDATHSGGVNLSNNTTARTLTVQVASGTSTIGGAIVNGGGSTGGNLTKTGAGELVLSGANTYTGTTTISAGSLSLGNNDRLADTSAVNIGATGTLHLNGFSDKVGTLTATGGATIDFGTAGTANTFIFGTYVAPPSGVLVISNWEQNVDKLATTVASQNVSTIYISGYGVAQQQATLSAMGGSYGNAYLLAPTIQAGIVWGGASSNAWNTGSNWAGGVKPSTTQIAVFNNVGAGRTAVSLNGGNTIAGVRFDANAAAYTITGANTLTLSGSVPYIQQMSANTQTLNFSTLALGNNTIVDITGSGNLAIGAVITGASRNLIRDGNGTGKLVLSGANTFSGGVFINKGIVQTRSDAGLGTGTTTISSGGTLELANNITASNAISVSGTGVGGNGAIRNVANSNTLSGTITMIDASRITADSGTTLTLTGDLTATNRDVLFGGAGNINVARITTGAGAVIVNSTGTVTYNTGNANTYTGDTTVNSGTLALGKTAGVDAIAGNLVVNTGGTVRLNANNQISDTSAVTLAGGTFNLNNFAETITTLASSSTASTVALGTTGALTVTDDSNAVYSGTFSGAGTFTKTGTGTLSLSGNSSGYTGTTNLNAGVLHVSGSNSVLGTGAVNVASGANLEIQGGRTLANNFTVNGSGTANDGALQSVSGNNTISGTVTLAGNTRVQSDAGTFTLANTISGSGHHLTIGGNGNTVVSGAIATGAGSLTKNGNGVLTLSGANTYTGATAINAGTLRLGANNVLSDSTAVTVASGATFDVNDRTDTIGSLAGAGTLDLGSGTLITGNASNTAFSGAISGNGTLVKQGTGTFTIDSDINFAGNIDLTAGTLVFSGAAPIVAGSLTLSGGTLLLDATTLTVGTLYIAGNTVIDFSGPSSSVLSVTNFELAEGVQLTINNWNNMVDYFIAQNWVGATQDVRNAAPMNQITFTGHSSSSTGWTSFQDEITPAPEPATYGAIMMAMSFLGLAWRRFAKKRAAAAR